MNEFIRFPKIPRYSRDCIVTEKIDGTNGQIYIEQAESDLPGSVARAAHGMEMFNVYAGSRSLWLTTGKDNHNFARWVADNAIELLKLGPGRHYGEWWGQGINRGYGLKEKRFSLFNVTRWSNSLARPACCHVVPVLWVGDFPPPVEMILANLKLHGSSAAPGYMNPEGIVVFQAAGNLLFKKTFTKDEEGKEYGH